MNASADATGLNPRGRLSVDAEGIHSYTGNVTCLSVIGNQASIGIEIVKSSDPALLGQGELWSVVDNAPDRIAGYEITPTPPVLCPSLFFNVPIVVRELRRPRRNSVTASGESSLPGQERARLDSNQ